MESYEVKTKRTISVEQQHTCDKCQEPATSACTDALQDSNAPDGWRQSDKRYGCPAHEVKPNVILTNGAVVEFWEYKRWQTANNS
jgi:hypothetical protein